MTENKRAVIIGGGGIYDYEYMRTYIRDTDFIICADHGVDHCLKMGLEPNIALGDFDSAECDVSQLKTVRFPRRKDFTDSELAVRYALDEGYSDIIMIAFSGTRLDHTIANIGLLSYINKRGGRGMIADEHNEIYLLSGECTLRGKRGDIVSVIPIGADSEGIFTEGLEYPLSGESLHWGECRGVSNVMTGGICTVKSEGGEALVIKSRD